MPDRFDVVVAGAGHNSLIAAAYLAKAGYRCLVLEGRQVVGGNCVTEELTLPGFQHDSCGTAHVVIQDSPMLRNDELGLGDYGLEYIHPEIVVHAPFPDGTYLTQYHDIDRTVRRVRQVLQEGCRRVPAHDRRLRRGQADLRRRLLHADRLGQAGQRAPRRTSRRQAVAAPHCDVGLGYHPRQFRGRSLPLVHAVDGVPDRGTAGMADVGTACIFAGPWPSALELVRAQGRVGDVLGRARPADRSA